MVMLPSTWAGCATMVMHAQHLEQGRVVGVGPVRIPQDIPHHVRRHHRPHKQGGQARGAAAVASLGLHNDQAVSEPALQRGRSVAVLECQAVIAHPQHTRQPLAAYRLHGRLQPLTVDLAPPRVAQHSPGHAAVSVVPGADIELTDLLARHTHTEWV